MHEPRVPNGQEAKQLADYLLAVEGDDHAADFVDEAEALDFAHTTVGLAAVAVFDGPYGDETIACDKLMAVVWPGDPACYEVFIWQAGKMVRLAQTPGLR